MMTDTHRRFVLTTLPIALALLWLGEGPALAQTSRVQPPGAEIVASLAPSGRLRAAINLGNGVLAQRDPKTGVVSGLIMDIANELARRLGTPIDFIYYETGGRIAPMQPTDRWDIAFLGTEQSRVANFAVTAPYLSLEGTYLVRAESPYRGVADLDRSGARVATALNSAYDLELSKLLKRATIIRAPTSAAAIELFAQDRLDAAAGVRQALEEAQKSTPGTRVLPDAYMSIEQAMTMPKGRDAGFRYLSDFIEDLKATGFVRRSLERSGQSATLTASGQSAK